MQTGGITGTDNGILRFNFLKADDKDPFHIHTNSYGLTAGYQYFFPYNLNCFLCLLHRLNSQSYGTDHAVVEAVFEDYLTPDVEAYLDDMGIEPEDVLVIRRKMTADGKNECRINGRVTTLSVLKGLTELLVDIHGQHEHQSLIKPANHEGMLDGIGGKDILSTRDKVGALHAEYRALKEEFSRFGDESERARRLDVLRFQLEEIERADIAEGEEEELLEKRKRIRNTEKILSALSSARSALEGYDGVSVGGNLKAAAASLHTISAFDEGIEPLCDRLDAAKTEIEDIGETLGDMMREFDFDAKSADAVEERLETVRNLQRKYGGSYAAMREFYDKAAAEADTLANASERVEALEREISAKGKELSAAAEKLGALRRKTAESFERAIMKELGDLGMGGTTFKDRGESCPVLYPASPFYLHSGGGDNLFKHIQIPGE